MAFPNRGWVDKAHALHRRQHPLVRRIVVAVVGGVLILAAAAMLVLPGPGVVVLLAGVAVLSLEFEWAARVMSAVRGAFDSVASRIRRGRS